MKKVGDLPKGVIEQWRRWCLDKDYAAGAEGPAMRARYAAVETPIVSLSFADDEYMSLANTRALHGLYANAPQTMKRIAPADIGERRIGHFGFFRPKYESAVAGATLAGTGWLRGRSPYPNYGFAAFSASIGK